MGELEYFQAPVHSKSAFHLTSVNHAIFLPEPPTALCTETDVVNTRWKLSLSGSNENLNFFSKSVVLLQCGPQTKQHSSTRNLVEVPRIMWELRHFAPEYLWVGLNRHPQVILALDRG